MPALHSVYSPTHISLMLHPRGCDHGTCAGPLSKHKDTVPSAQENIDIGLFQRTVLLTEEMNKLKCHINSEKQKRHDDLNDLEVVSSDEEEIEVPVESIPFMPPPFLPSQTLVVHPTPPSLKSLPMADIHPVENTTHIPTLYHIPNPTDTTLPGNNTPFLMFCLHLSTLNYLPMTGLS